MHSRFVVIVALIVFVVAMTSAALSFVTLVPVVVVVVVDVLVLVLVLVVAVDQARNDSEAPSHSRSLPPVGKIMQNHSRKAEPFQQRRRITQVKKQNIQVMKQNDSSKAITGSGVGFRMSAYNCSALPFDRRQ